MRLDRELQKEIRALYGDGGQAARLDALARVYQARAALSRLEVRRTFPDALRAHGRAAVAVCVAATLWTRRERLDGWGSAWARLVLDALPFPMTPTGLLRACIDDGLHPTAICTYAGAFVKLTVEP